VGIPLDGAAGNEFSLAAARLASPRVDTIFNMWVRTSSRWLGAICVRGRLPDRERGDELRLCSRRSRRGHPSS